MKHWIRGLVVSALAVGTVTVASPLARADIAGIPACADVVFGGPDYSGNAYVGPTDLTLDPKDSTQSQLLNVLPAESDGSLHVPSKLAAASCTDVTYRLTVIYPGGDSATETYEQQGDGASDVVTFDVAVKRHSGTC